MNFRSLALSVSALLVLGAATQLSAQATFFKSGSLFGYKETFDTKNADIDLFKPSLNTGWFAYTDATGGTPLGISAITGSTLPTTSQGIFQRSDSFSTDWALGTVVNDSSSTFYYGVAIQNNTGGDLRNLAVSINSSLLTAGNGATAEFRVGSAYSATPDDWTSISALSLSASGTRSAALFSEASDTFKENETLWFRWKAEGVGASTLDDFLIIATPVPEPSTYAMLLGLGTVGFVCYRRRARR